jgi:hypothetical protein
VADKISTAENVLIFGLGNDSDYYAACNRGHTYFVENNLNWCNKFKHLNVHHYVYKTKVKEGIAPLIIDLPLYDKFWDVVLIDGPTGYGEEEPGRTQPIYSVSQMVVQHLFVDDYDRKLERECCDAYLGEPSEVISSKYAYYLRI